MHFRIPKSFPVEFLQNISGEDFLNISGKLSKISYNLLFPIIFETFRRRPSRGSADNLWFFWSAQDFIERWNTPNVEIDPIFIAIYSA